MFSYFCMIPYRSCISPWETWMGFRVPNLWLFAWLDTRDRTEMISWFLQLLNVFCFSTLNILLLSRLFVLIRFLLRLWFPWRAQIFQSHWWQTRSLIWYATNLRVGSLMSCLFVRPSYMIQHILISALISVSLYLFLSSCICSLNIVKKHSCVWW